MTTSIGQQVLLQTKLHQPRVTADLVHRPRLQSAMNDGLDHPLILVAAPAGFGKSTLVSAWLETCDLPHAWISLDPTDNDLGVFLAYFVSAIQTIVPDALPETHALLTGISLPVVAVVTQSLLNDLDRLGRDFILALDDYHLIHEQPIHDLLGLLLQHPPQGMHLVIVTRREPPLPLSVLRARHQLVEIRGQDLRFSRAEIAAFVERALKVSLSDKALAMLAEKTEGWAAGLRLTMLTLRESDDFGSHITGLHAENRYVLDYLMSEVLAQLPPSLRRFLLKTSILDQVCRSLSEALIGPEDPECQPQEFLVWLQQANMFTVALDTRGEWYRYHHLFQALLRDQLTSEASTDEIAALHTRASAWYARQGLLEKALQHALLGNDTPSAVRLLAEQRHALMNSEQWQLLQHILDMFPVESITNYPELILMAAQVAGLKQFDWASILPALDRAESLLAQMPEQPERAVYLRGEIDALRGIYACETVSDPANVIALTQRALTTMPRAWYYMRASSWLYLAAAYQMAGRLDLAYNTLAEGQPEDVTSGAVHARVAGSRAFIEWMAGDLPAIPQAAREMLDVSKTHQRHESQGWAHYLFSSVAYERNDLTTAETHARDLANLRYVGRPMAYLQSAFIDASICQARGQPDHAQQKLDLAFEFLNETGSEGLMPLAQAFQAELALRKGDPGAARHWATTAGPFLPFTALPYYYAPQLTLPKFLLALDTSGSRRQAAEVLSRLHGFVTSIHNTPFTIEVLALQALLHDAQGDRTAALALLQQAVALAEPGGFIRLFVDLGSRLANLLAQLRRAGVAAGYVDQILPSFNEPAVTVPHPNTAVPVDRHMELVEPLTNRELEVLVLLAQRLSNKEIAQLLVISTQTVKRHAANIYQKLQVDGRRAAVVEATRLGLL